MLDYIVKVSKKYKLDPQKVVEGCIGHPVLVDKDPELCFYPSYEGVKGRYHRFFVPAEVAIGVLVEQIQFEADGLVKKILIEAK